MKKIVLYAAAGMMLLWAGASSGMLEQDDKAVVNCSGQKLGNARAKEILDQIKHPELVREINLSNCKITSADKSQLNRFVNLQKLDLSRNRLGQIDLSQLTKLNDLNLSYTQLQQVDVRQLPQLKKFDFSGNKDFLKLKEILYQIQNAELVKEIDISDCDIELVNELQLNRFVNLHKLNLSDNRLQEVDISQLTELEDLNLSKAYRLQEVDLHSLTKLKKLDLSENQLRQVDVSQLPELQKLNLSWNELHQIDLSKLTQLKHLDLSRNKLQEVDVSQLTNLQYLDLSYNKLQPDFVIENLMELESLLLAQINIKNLNFRNLSKLKSLRISWNRQLARFSILGDVQSIQEITYNGANPNCEIIVEGGRLPNLNKLETDHKELFDHISMPLIQKNKVQQEEMLEDKIFLK